MKTLATLAAVIGLAKEALWLAVGIWALVTANHFINGLW